MVESLRSAGELSIRNFKRAMLNGIKVTTRYSGMGCVEVVFRMLSLASAEVGSPYNAEMWSAFEKDPGHQKMLCACEQWSGTFSSVCQRMTLQS